MLLVVTTLTGRVEYGARERISGCQKCGNGVLLPLSDYGREGAPIRYKAWVCSHPDCGFNIRIDNGEVTVGRQIGQSYK